MGVGNGGGEKRGEGGDDVESVGVRSHRIGNRTQMENGMLRERCDTNRKGHQAALKITNCNGEGKKGGQCASISGV